MFYTYTVQKGDTLFRLARRHAINVESLLGANPALRKDDPLVPGQVVRIPERPINRYLVQAGDTLAFIAKRFNLSKEELITANPGLDPRALRIGQGINLPPGGSGERIVRGDLPYGFQELAADIVLLTRRFPFIEVRSIGETVLGKPIWALRLGHGPVQLHANAAVHANEWITAPALLQFAEEYAAALAADGALRGQSAARLAEKTTLWLVPMVNPDGVELVHQSVTPPHPYCNELLAWNNGSFGFTGWKANVRGVDLNDQFPAHWEDERARREVESPGPRDYTGEAPLSEPEAAALARFTQEMDFRLVVSLHTQGRELYWNYRGMEPPESAALAVRLGKASGLTLVELTGSDAGYKDWFIQTFRRPGFTAELGFGVNPLPLEQFPDLYESAAGLLLECLLYGAGLDAPAAPPWPER